MTSMSFLQTDGVGHRFPDDARWKRAVANHSDRSPLILSDEVVSGFQAEGR